MGIASGNQKYSRGTAVVYMFNLIVGVGALSLPLGFHQAGYVLGMIFLACIGLLSYITATWIVESQAAANALLYMSVLKREDIPFFNSSLNPPEVDQERFEINQRTEISLMADLFLGKRGKAAFYVVLTIYLLGDLAIYAVTVPKSLVYVTGGFDIGHKSLSADDVYHLYVFIFALIVVPLSLFNFQKTRYLQICTLFCRNLAFFLMIILAIVFISQNRGANPHELAKFEMSGLPNLFGLAVYAFMCHHSLPSIITPVTNKKGIHKVMGLDFLFVFLAYITLCLTAQFAFGTETNPTCTRESRGFVPCTIQQLYNLNFASYNVRVIADFLALYSLFTLTTNYPLIAITLRNNVLLAVPERWGRPKVRYAIVSLAASIIPIIVALITQSVDKLVSFTGSYAGLGIQMVIPALLAYRSRIVIANTFGKYTVNPYRSFFAGPGWIWAILVLSGAFLCMVTFNHINNYVHIIKY
eukprot:Phypoly_transcript_08502.p1 GENE.Phypoly_transcript_08502~~Phypoly_transcript_08502.p1  ORF type:complete len:470 (+),score=23.36 Phypoly_transcript_08502:93-1502(+)